MRISTILLTTLLVLNSFAQAKEYKFDEPPMTIEPPAGFTEANNFKGFEQLETFTTIIIDSSEKSLSSAIAEQLAQNLETLANENVSVSGKEGLLLKLKKSQANTEFHQWLLLLGDKLGHVSVKATYPAAMANALGPMLKQTLLNIKLNTYTVERLFNNLPYHIKGDIAPLTYQSRTQNSVILVNKAPYDGTNTFAPTYIISHDEMPEPITDLVQFSLDKVNNNNLFESTTIDEQKFITIAGVQTYLLRTQAVHRKTGAKMMFYQAIAVNDKRYLLVQAVAPQAEQNQYLKIFNQITNSIAFKEAAK